MREAALTATQNYNSAPNPLSAKSATRETKLSQLVLKKNFHLHHWWVIPCLANHRSGATCLRIPQRTSPHEFRCKLPFRRYVATLPKEHQVNGAGQLRQLFCLSGINQYKYAVGWPRESEIDFGAVCVAQPFLAVRFCKVHASIDCLLGLRSRNPESQEWLCHEIPHESIFSANSKTGIRIPS
jgi:hypothetical protein